MIKIVDYGHMKVSDIIEGFMEARDRDRIYSEAAGRKLTNRNSFSDIDWLPF